MRFWLLPIPTPGSQLVNGEYEKVLQIKEMIVSTKYSLGQYCNFNISACDFKFVLT